MSRGHARGLHAVVLVIGPLLAVTACAPSPSPPDDGPLDPPFVVSDHFFPTGYMGDGATPGLVTMTTDACATRAPDANGDCYAIRYTPSIMWAGVLWQYPANNWGDTAGRTILAGATRVSAWARGERGGETIEIHVGGVASPHYRDTIDVKRGFTLTTSWQRLTVDLGTASYDRVIGAFGWTATATREQAGAGPIVFYLDGIAWER